jgi:hypothetical protein
LIDSSSESRLRVKVSDPTGVIGYITATMSCGASWFCTNSLNGRFTAMSLPRRT